MDTKTSARSSLLRIALLLLVFSIVDSSEALEWEELHYRAHVNGERQFYLRSAAFGNGTWVVAGDYVMASTNATNWVWIGRYAPNLYLLKVVFAANKFVAVGVNDLTTPGTVQSIIGVSDDGFSWRNVVDERVLTPPDIAGRTDLLLMDIAYGLSGFIAVGEGSGKAVYLSEDGEHWRLTPSDTMSECNAVTFANGRYYIAGMGIISSEDRINWRVDVPVGRFLFQSIGFASGFLFASGTDANGVPGIWRSVNGSDWVREASGKLFRGIGGAFGEVLAASSGYRALARRSPAGLWRDETIPAEWEPCAAAYGDGYIYVVGSKLRIIRTRIESFISVAAALDASHIVLNVTGKPGIQIDLQSSVNLSTWSAMTNFTMISSNAVLRQTTPNGKAFYRAVAR